MKTITKISALLLLAITVFAGCGRREAQKPPDKVTVQLAWVHRALFAGFYAAD